MTLSYPAELPMPQRSGYGFEPVNQIRRTEMQSGRARQRVEFTSVPTFATLTWVCTQLQAQYFEAWTLQVAGAGWFTMKLSTPLGLTDHEVRFAESPRGPMPFAPGHWTYSARVEVRERPQLPPGLVEFPELLFSRDIIDIAINQEWPA